MQRGVAGGETVERRGGVTEGTGRKWMPDRYRNQGERERERERER